MSIVSTAQLPRELRQGFTLFELLLAVFLLSLLFGALIFSFTTLKSGAELNEGIDRFESLLRFARAHAAYSGCRVQLQFEPDPTLPFAPDLYRIQLSWESEPSENPGTYRPLHATAWNLEGINDIVAVAEVRQADTTDPLSPPEPDETESDSITETDPGEEAAIIENMASALPPLTFFPDGTCDSAQIVLVSRAEDDPRRVRVRVTGITGSFSREWITQAEQEAMSEEEESTSELEDPTMESDDEWLTETTESENDWLTESSDTSSEMDYDWISDILDEMEQADEVEPIPTPEEAEDVNRVP